MTTNEYLAIFGAMAALFFPIIGGWINVRITIAKQAVQIENLKENHVAFNNIVTKIFEELKEINERLSEKADRQ